MPATDMRFPGEVRRTTVAQHQMITVLECAVGHRLPETWSPASNSEMETGRDKPLSPSSVSKGTRRVERKCKCI